MRICRFFRGFAAQEPDLNPLKPSGKARHTPIKPGVFARNAWMGFVAFLLTSVSLALSQPQPSVPYKVGSDQGPTLGDGLFEITPQAGFMGGSSLVGIKGAMLYHGFSLEAAADQVIGRYATLYPLTLNMVFNLSQGKKIVPFGIIGGGLFLTKPENTVGDDVLSTLGINVGGGIRLYFNSRFGVRFETKQYFTEIENKSVGHPELLIYQSSSLGVIIAFI